MTRLLLIIFTTTLLTFAGNVLAGGNHPDDKKVLQKIESALGEEKDPQAFEELMNKLESENSFYRIRQLILKASRGAIDVNIVNLLIFKRCNLADRLFALAKQHRVEDNETFYRYIVAVGKSKDFAKAEYAFEKGLKRLERLKNQLEVDEDTLQKNKKSLCTAYMQAAGECNELGEVDKAFNSTGLKTPGVYTNFMKAVAKCKELKEGFKKVQEVYNQALQAGCSMDPRFFADYIAIAGDAEDYSEVKSAFEKASKMEFDEKAEDIRFVYDSYITALGLFGRVDEATEIFNLARKNGYTNDVTYNLYFNVLVQGGRVGLALETLSKCGFIEKAKKDDGDYDFHGSSFGAVYIATHLLISELEVGKGVTFIVGQRSHYQGENVLSRAVNLFVRLSDGAVTSEIDQKNPGILRLRLRSQYNPEHVLNTSFSYQSNPAGGESRWNAATTSSNVPLKQLNRVQRTETSTNYPQTDRGQSYDQSKSTDKDKSNRGGRGKYQRRSRGRGQEPVHKRETRAQVPMDKGDSGEDEVEDALKNPISSSTINRERQRAERQRDGSLAGQVRQVVRNAGTQSFKPYK